MARRKEPFIRTPQNVFEELRKPKASAQSLGVTYAEVHSWGWLSETTLRGFVAKNWPDLAKGGVTQRTRKVWGKIVRIAHPQDTDRLEGSVWSVRWYGGSFKPEGMGAPPKPRGWSTWRRPLSDLGCIGHVVAATAEEAKQIAMVTLGPLAMMNSNCVSVDRLGPGGEGLALSRNRDVVKELDGQIAGMQESLRMMQWELEQMTTLRQFITNE
jgi:hypothetical protein